MSDLPRMVNGTMLPLTRIPLFGADQFARILGNLLGSGCRVAAYFALPGTDDRQIAIYAVLADFRQGNFVLLGQEAGEAFTSLTPLLPQLHLFEREIAEQYGVPFVGHPWFKPVRFHSHWNGRQDIWGRGAGHPLIGDMAYFQVEGEEIHEVGVGPVHAGVIEPGHFRFQCYGEKVLHLEISLGYQHRGLEQLLAGGPHAGSAMQMEGVAGDTSIGHMTAFSLICEALAGCRISPRAAALRTVALELERLANHVGDIGALAGDIGFLPTASYCGRLRGDYLNMTAALCGSRFGRGLVRPGGVCFDAEPQLCDAILANLTEVARHTAGAFDLFFNTPSVLARLEGTGTVPARVAAELGLTGVAGRACGLDCDVRRFFADSNPEPHEVPEMVEESGDVFARAMVRRREVSHSLSFIRQRLAALPQGECRQATAALAPNALALGAVEGWRGMLTHVAVTDDQGRFRRYKMVDPSFFNWSGLALALREEQISDFPLCNKSFNLSYCGFDL